MNYRIHLKELKEKIPVPKTPSGYIICKFGDITFYAIPEWFSLMKNIFPRIFVKESDFWRQFITKEYFNPNNIFVAIEKATGKMASVFGCQELKTFDPPSAILIYIGTAEEHRRKGLMRVLCSLTCNQLIDQKCNKLFGIPANGSLISSIYQKIGFEIMSEEYTRKYTKAMQQDKPYEP